MRAALALLASSQCSRWTCPPAALRDEEGRFYGMLRERDLTPFGFLRLDMRPAHAVSIEPHSFAFEMELGYQNTWALSRERREVSDRSRIAGAPSSIGPADDRGHPQSARRELSARPRVRDARHGGALQALEPVDPVRHRDRGLVPGRLHGFGHRRVSRHLRLQLLRPPGDRAQRRPTSSSISRVRRSCMLDAPKTQGFTDPIFGLRYTGINLPGRWQMSVEAAIKVPLEGERMLLSTGRTDYGMQASVRHLGERNAFHMDLRGGVLRRRRHTRAARGADRAHHHHRLGTPADRRAPISTCRAMRARACTRASRPISTNC